MMPCGLPSGCWSAPTEIMDYLSVGWREMTLQKKLIGHVGVDSGQLLIADPCYLSSEKNLQDYDSVMDVRYGHPWRESDINEITLKRHDAGEPQADKIPFNLGHEGAGVVFNSGYGDGEYPVYAYVNEDGRIVKVLIEMSL
jgi:hypothetical protein